YREAEKPPVDLLSVPGVLPGCRVPKCPADPTRLSNPTRDPRQPGTPVPFTTLSLGGRDIWVNVRSEKDAVWVALHIGSSGEVVVSTQDSHVGGLKVNVATRKVDPRAILSNPQCSKVTKGHSASGLYIICEGKHTGKLVRWANYFAEGNLWVLQVMRPKFHPEQRKQFSVEIDDGDPVLKRIPGNALVMMMCIVRKAAGGNTNGYDIDGHGRIVKLGHT
ncbi:hypothetical protein FB446DRAFT_710256, partial [Lentinula raphanica]